MKSAFTSPVLVPPEGADVVLERIPLSGPTSTAAYDEKWLQDILYRHPAALPVPEIDDAFSGMVPVCQEMPTQAGPVDVVYVTRSGRPVLVEAKLWRNPEARRKVLGQILDYAKELSRWSYETFDAAVRRARRAEDGGTPRTLSELMGLKANAREAAAFHDALTRSLRRGDLLLLIVGDGIREGVAAITEFLEGHASLHFTFGLVEMAVYRMPDGGQLVQPRVLAQSTIVKRTVVELRSDSMEVRESDVGPESEAADEALPRELVESRQRFEAFWSAFLKKLQLDDQSQPVGKPGRAQNQFFYMPKGTSAWVSAYLAESRRKAGVYLSFSKGPLGDRLYSALREDRAAIDAELGVAAEWVDVGAYHEVVSSTPLPGALEEHAERIQATLADWTNRYVNVFRPRLEKLAREVT